MVVTLRFNVDQRSGLTSRPVNSGMGKPCGYVSSHATNDLS